MQSHEFISSLISVLAANTTKTYINPVTTRLTNVFQIIQLLLIPINFFQLYADFLQSNPFFLCDAYPPHDFQDTKIATGSLTPEEEGFALSHQRPEFFAGKFVLAVHSGLVSS